MIDRNRVLRRSPNAVTEHIGEECFIMAKHNLKVYRLGSTAGIIWSQLDGSRSVAEIVAAIHPTEAAPADGDFQVTRFLDSLVALNLAEPC